MLEAADLIEVLCSRIEVLEGWGFSSQQQFLAQGEVGHSGRSRETCVVGIWGWGHCGVRTAEVGPSGAAAVPVRGFTVINPSFRALHAAKLLGAVRWADDDRTYVPLLRAVRARVLGGE